MKKTPMGKIFSMGMISVWISVLAIGIFALVELDIAEKGKLPEYQGEGGWGLAFELWGSIFLICLPLLVSSLIVGIVSILMDKGRTAGIVAVSGTAVLMGWAMIAGQM